MGYDEAGRVKSVPGFVSDLTWDALGRPDTKTNANGVFTDWTWSPNRGLLDRIQTTTAGGAILQDLTYTQRAAGLVQSVTSPVAGEGWTYDYDDFYHLTTATNHSYPGESQTFDYDAGGRIQTNSRVGVYTYATGRHQPQTVGGSTLVYDANGNLVSGGGRAPVWNAENLITQIGTTQFKYDALGERVKKTGGSATSLYPFGDDYEITNGVVTKYMSIEGVGVVAKKVTGGSSPGTYWFLSDHLGSLQGVLDVNGAAISRRTYRPYGQTLGQSGSHTESRGWIDQRNDTETGLTYLHARYFDPQLGTFLNADPIGVEGGLNQYGYGFGDPVNSADRSGLDPNFVFCYPWPRCAAGGGGGGSPGGGGFSAPGSPWPYGSPPPGTSGDVIDTLKSIGCFLFGAFCGPTPGSTLTGPNMALPQQGPPQDRGVTMPDHPTGAPAGATPSGGSNPPPPPPPPGPPSRPARGPIPFEQPTSYPAVTAAAAGGVGPLAAEGGSMFILDEAHGVIEEYAYFGGGVGLGFGGNGAVEIGVLDAKRPDDVTGWGLQVGAFAAVGPKGAVTSYSGASSSWWRLWGNGTSSGAAGWAVGGGFGVAGLRTYTWKVRTLQIDRSPRWVREAFSARPR
jgi:RHS repeat-associated protein